MNSGQQRSWVSATLLFAACAIAGCSVQAQNSVEEGVQNASGLRMVVAPESARPVIRILLPGSQRTDRTIEVIFPEHVTARKTGLATPEHLYLYSEAEPANRPAWRKVAQTLEYVSDLRGGVHLLARASLQDDGVLFHYVFTNSSSQAYEMIYAVTDPRLIGAFHDVRLERTYVHHPSGFDLLASETPARLTMPLDQWLPARYLDSFTWPVPQKLIEHREDGITYYNNSKPVDEPLIATLSTDRKWVVASFTRTTGNVWSNPELTCQHVDPETSLPAGGKAELEVKILVLPGTLDEVLKKVHAQRNGLN